MMQTFNLANESDFHTPHDSNILKYIYSANALSAWAFSKSSDLRPEPNISPSPSGSSIGSSVRGYMNSSWLPQTPTPPSGLW